MIFAESQPDALKPIRSFIALNIPAEVKAAMGKVQTELRDLLKSNARWTALEQFHLTLRFLGNIEPSRLEALIAALDKAVENVPPLQLKAASLGSFPLRGAPRVIWVGVTAADDQLLRLHSAVEEAVAGFTNEPGEKEFSGHVTLARLKDVRRAPEAQLVEMLRRLGETCFGTWVADQMDLVRSDLSGTGARHSAMATIRFRGNA